MCYELLKDKISWDTRVHARRTKQKPMKCEFLSKASMQLGTEELDEAPEIGYGHFLQDSRLHEEISFNVKIY